MSKLVRFKNFLTGLGPVEEIRRDCQSFLKQSYGPLFRGVGFTVNPWKMMSAQVVRKKRSPRDSSRLAHELMDDWFDDHFELRPRSQGLFCAATIDQTEKYGSPCFVFPVGSFRSIWASHKGHPIVDTLTIANQIYKEDFSPLPRDREHAEEIADGIMRQIDWHVDELAEGQRLEAEITILCDHYYLVPINKKNWAEQYEKITSR